MKYKVLLICAVCYFSSIYAVWQELPNMNFRSLRLLALKDAKNIWRLADGTMYKWENNNWTSKGKVSEAARAGLFVDLSVGVDNAAYVMVYDERSEETNIYRFDGMSSRKVHTLKGGATAMAAVNSNNIWINRVELDGSNIRKAMGLFHWNGKTWKQRGDGSFSGIKIGRDGVLIGIKDMTMLMWDGSPRKDWRKLYTFSQTYATYAPGNPAVVDKNNIWIVNTSKASQFYNPYQWNAKRKTWIRRGGIRAAQVAAGRDGTILLASFTETGPSGEGNFSILKWTNKPAQIKKEHTVKVEKREPRAS